MANKNTSFPAGIDFESVLRIISKQIYATPLAFIRENVQNAVDAIRIQAHREGKEPKDSIYKINITVEDKKITIHDNGTGMSASDLQNFFWTIGASGKRTKEALAAGCVGTFGIGGFANFGVCEILEVISQTEGVPLGTLTRLSETDIKSSGSTIPSITSNITKASAPRGTIVNGYLRKTANVDELRNYLRGFVKFVPIAVYFNSKMISQRRFSDIEERDNFTEISSGQWYEEDLVITGRLFEDLGHTLIVSIDGLKINNKSVNLVGHLRFENGTIDVFKRGFKLCATQIGSIIGASGRLDCDRFVPTAGRDSLNGNTTSLLGRIVLALEKVVVEAVLESPERIAQHTRIFSYILKHSMISKLGKLRVNLADGSESLFEDIRKKAEQGKVKVFFGIAQKQALNQIMQARGHIVVLLSSDKHRREAEKRYLQHYCSANPFDGMIDCIEHYEALSRFEMVFLSELESNISTSYEIEDFRLTPGKLTDDIPVYVKEQTGNRLLDIFVDVRHQEIAKLEELGYTQLLYSLIATFCHEYLGQALKKWSPRFFGNGALNLELFAKRRSELWILLKDDISIMRKSGHRQVVKRSDVQIVNAKDKQNQPESRTDEPPRLVHIIDRQGKMKLDGFYIRLPDLAFNAYGDLLPECDSRGVVWAGNKIMYVISDAVSAAFQYEIRLDEIVAAKHYGMIRAEGAIQLKQPLQKMYAGIYFPIPTPLEPFIVPKDVEEIRLELHCDWIDMRTAKHWAPKESEA